MTDAFVYYAKITAENEKLVKTSYDSRTEKEVPVLRRYFSKDDVPASKAKYLDVILYSREQIRKETAAMKDDEHNKDVDYEWGIIWIIELLQPGFVGRYSRGHPMTSGQVKVELPAQYRQQHHRQQADHAQRRGGGGGGVQRVQKAAHRADYFKL